MDEEELDALVSCAITDGDLTGEEQRRLAEELQRLRGVVDRLTRERDEAIAELEDWLMRTRA